MVTTESLAVMNARCGGIVHSPNGHNGIVLTFGNRQAEVRPIKQSKNGARFRFRAPGHGWTGCSTEKGALRRARRALMCVVN